MKTSIFALLVLSISCDAKPESEALQIAAGYYHTCVWTEGESARCWGNGSSGALGYGDRQSIGDDETAGSAGTVDIGRPVQSMSLGNNRSCALFETGEALCWGAPNLGQPLGNRSQTETPSHFDAIEVGASVSQVAVGDSHTCVTTNDHAVRCWGEGRYGQLGYGNREAIGDDENPASVGNVDLGADVLQVATGGAHTCALQTSGDVRCWGGGSIVSCNPDVVGDDEPASHAALIDLDDDVVKIAAGMFHTCALTKKGEVHCWGSNRSGALGYPAVESISEPEMVAAMGPVNLGSPAVDVVLGGKHTCALLEGGTVKCWGDGDHGKLGYGNVEHVRDPSTVGSVELGGVATALAAGFAHTCAVLDGERVQCWGQGAGGQLGHGDTRAIGDDESPASSGYVPLF